LNRINDESQRIYQTNFQVISLKEFITNIIFLNIHDPDCFKDDLRVFFIKVLARIITEKNLNNKVSTKIDLVGETASP
jgi:inositol 1,4,5-triphosphate receptor type 1/inositol 1,4,5-triphosphate receptor type 3